MCTHVRLRSAAPARGCAQQLSWTKLRRRRVSIMRQARNGDIYSKEQFLAHYGTRGETMWNQAAYYVIGSPYSSAEPGPSSEPPTETCGAAERAEVLAPLQSTEDLAHDSEAPPDATPGICGAAEPAEVDDSVGLVALNATFMQSYFKNMAKPQTGGKAVCQKQREIRAQLLATADVREANLTVSDFDWKAVPKSLPTGVDIVGTGVCKLAFRLLRDVRDPTNSKLIVASVTFSKSQ